MSAKEQHLKLPLKKQKKMTTRQFDNFGVISHSLNNNKIDFIRLRFTKGKQYKNKTNN